MTVLKCLESKIHFCFNTCDVSCVLVVKTFIQKSPSTLPENNIHVHDLLTFQQITVVSKAKGATLFACDLQVRYSPLVAAAHRRWCSYDASVVCSISKISHKEVDEF